MSRRRILVRVLGSSLALVLAAMAAGPRPAEAGPVVYATEYPSSVDSGEFGTLDLATGHFTSIGALNTDGTMITMGYGNDGQLYGLTTNGQLYRIDPTTGGATDLSTGLTPVFTGAANDGTFYEFGANQGGYFGYSTFSPPSTQPTGMFLNVYWSGQTPYTFDSTGMVAFGPDGKMYLAASDPNAPPNSFTYALATASPQGGVATEIGSMGSADVGLGLFVGSTLYGFEGGTQIVTIDTTTGAVTLGATTDAPGGITAAVAFAPSAVPEGSSLAMLASGAIGAGLAVRRRRWA